VEEEEENEENEDDDDVDTTTKKIDDEDDEDDEDNEGDEDDEDDDDDEEDEDETTKKKKTKKAKGKSKTKTKSKSKAKAKAKGKKKGKGKKEGKKGKDEKQQDADYTASSGNKRKREKSTESSSPKKQKDESAPITTFTVRPIQDDSQHLKIVSWNVNGISAFLKKGTFAKFVEEEKPDVIFLQETKANESHTIPNFSTYRNYHWNFCKNQKGYSGTAFFSKIKTMNITADIGVAEHDQEGRVITAEFDDYYIVGTYIPNSGRKLDRLTYRQKWNKDFLQYLKKLETRKPVIWTGDLNVAHEEIDLANPKTNKKTAGFTIEERRDMTNLLSNGFIDVWRKQHPNEIQYTFWSNTKKTNKEKNIGWRLDYYIVSESLFPSIVDCYARPDVDGSDHCPLILMMPRSLQQSTPPTSAEGTTTNLSSKLSKCCLGFCWCDLVQLRSS